MTKYCCVLATRENKSKRIDLLYEALSDCIDEILAEAMIIDNGKKIWIDQTVRDEIIEEFRKKIMGVF